MAGHLMVRYFREKTPHSVFYTSRNQKDPGSLYTDARDLVLVRHVVEAVHPDILVNCIGILNDSAERDPAQAYHVNGRLPHLLKQVVNQVGGKLVQISTDCVFRVNREDMKSGNDRMVLRYIPAPRLWEKLRTLPI
nr:sugar nucleotide-binding protein [Paenibacillus larvae]